MTTITIIYAFDISISALDLQCSHKYEVMYIYESYGFKSGLPGHFYPTKLVYARTYLVIASFMKYFPLSHTFLDMFLIKSNWVVEVLKCITYGCPQVLTYIHMYLEIFRKIASRFILIR